MVNRQRYRRRAGGPSGAGSIHARLIAVWQQRYLPVVSVNHHRLGRILAPDDTESAATGPGLGGHAQAIGTPSALGEPETHPGGSAERHRHVDLGFIRDAGAVNPPMSGPAANAVSRAPERHVREPDPLADWILNGITSPEATSVDVISAESVPLDVDKPRA